MIHLDYNHKARKSETFLLRQQILQLIPGNSLITDAWHVPSGVDILAPTPAKAAAILKYKDEIAQRFGNATIERQQSWPTYIIGPSPKIITILVGPLDPVDGLLLQEPAFASIRDKKPIRQLAWTKRSKESPDLEGYIRIHIPEYKAHKFPHRLQIY